MAMKPNEYKEFLRKSLVKMPHRAVFVQGPVGVGKCIHFNSRNDFIVSGNGKLLHIKDLPKKVLALNEQYKLDKSIVKKNYNRIVKKLLRITTRSGRRIELTPEHPLLTINGWEEVRDIKVGAYIATPRRYDLKLKKEISLDYVKIMAYLLAEGKLGKGVFFTNSDEKLVTELKQCIEGYYSTLTLKKLGMYSKYGYIISKKVISNKHKERINPLLHDLEKEGLRNTNSKTKFIPNNIMCLSNKQVAIFLNRFYTCDGWAYKNHIGLCLKSETMIRQIQHLLLRFGILSSVKSKMKYATNTKLKKKQEYWEMYITNNESRDIFKREIGFYLEKKQQKIQVNKKSNTNVDIIPIKPGKKQHYRDSKGKFIKGYGRLSKGVLPKLPAWIDWKYPSRDMLLKFAKFYNDKNYYRLANSDIFWDEIKKVEVLTGSFKVWDIEVNHKGHNFVANDIIVHNSDCTKQVIDELKWEYVDIRLSLLDATDLRGLPMIDKEKGITKWTRPVFLPDENDTKERVLFFDEFNTSNKSMQNACLSLMLDRKIGEYHLPDNTRVLCAGNRIQDVGSFVSRQSPALNNRFIHLEFQTSFDDWKQWAYSNKMNPLVIGFHNYRKGDLLYKFKEDVDNTAFPTPRTWAFLGLPDGVLELGLANGALFEAIKGTVGEGAGNEFYAFLKIHKDLPKPEDILLKGKDIVPKESNIMYALCSALINCVREHKDKIGRLVEYSMKIEKEFSVVLIKDLLKTDMKDKVLSAKAFNEWVRVNKDIVV